MAAVTTAPHIFPTKLFKAENSIKAAAVISAISTILYVGILLGNIVGERTCTTAAQQRVYEISAPKHLQVQAHRGGAGMIAESTLYAFAYAIDARADVIEMDAVFTKDGIPVIWHDWLIEPDKCTDTIPGANFVGKYIANLTLAEVKTLECGGQQSESHTQAKTFPGAQIQTLEEVLDFIECYGDNKIEINLETKLDSRWPNFTLPVENYITDLVPIIKSHGMLHRVHLQSFDWRSIKGIKELYPEARINALVDETTVDIVEAMFNGLDWVTAASQIGVESICPYHGSLHASGDAGATINTPGYVPFTTKELVGRAHDLGMKVIVWTVDDESTIEKVIHDGVDGVISNYPLRVGYVGRDLGYTVNISKAGPAIPATNQCLSPKMLPPALRTPTATPEL